MKIDEKINKKNHKISPDSFESINLIDKKIDIYKDFIIVNEHIFNYMKNNFDKSVNEQNIFYLYKKNRDIITIETNKLYTILIRTLNEKNDSYKIEYILEFDSEEYFKKEKEILSYNNIENYIKSKTIFNNEKDNDLISPILEEKKIGNFYKYEPNIDYTSLKDYYNLMYSDIGKSILNSIKLYLNYNNIIEKMNKKKYRTKNEKYYLINKNSINQMKIDNNYEEIKTILEANGVKKNDEYNIKKCYLYLKVFLIFILIKKQKKII